MKLHIIISTLAAAAAIFAAADASINRSPSPAVRSAYSAGESLEYTVKFCGITGGRALMTVSDTILNSTHLNHIRCEAKTSGIADVFYKVRDTYQSFVDVNSQQPVKAIRDIKEGKYTYYDEVTYNRANSTVNVFKRNRKGHEKHSIDTIQPNTLDILSAFYNARNQVSDRLAVGDTLHYATYFSGEMFHLDIIYQGKETIKTNFGRLNCYKFAPVTQVGRSFTTDNGMNLWLTADARRIPIRIKFELPVGSFTADLTTAHTP